MSSTAMTPPTPQTETTRSSANDSPQTLAGRGRALVTPLNLHLAGVGVLVVLVLYLVVHLLVVVQSLHANNADALEQQTVALHAAQIAARPLRGLDTKLQQSATDANEFYDHRLPYAISQVAAEMGALAQRTNVHLSRIQYAYQPELSGDDALTEVRMDASVSGDYRPIVEFINAAERDKLFFVIVGVGLSGQQTGQVNLRIRMTSYLRAPHAGEIGETVLPAETDATGKAAQPQAGGAR